MRQLYEQVRVDENQMRFYAECEISGEKIFSRKLPALCRNKVLIASLQQGSVGGLRQMLYNRTHAASIQDLARYFNQCRNCGKWVCDKEYDPEEMKCKQCKDLEI